MPKIGGVVSGMDTSGVLDQLKAIAQVPIAKLQARKAALDEKSKAWDALSVKFSSFRAAAQAVTDKFTTRPAMATSSNTTLLGVQVTGSPEVGLHTLKVVKTARGQESMSNQVADTDTAVMADGTLTLKLGNGTEDHDLSKSTLLSSLNNGAGVVLGSIRITDRSGTFAVVDLTGNTTLQDVIDDISSAAGVKVTATLNEDGTGLRIKDDTGLSTGGLVVTEEGSTTAASLGLLGSSADGELIGDDLDPKHVIAVDSSNNTLEGLRDAINALGIGVAASIVDDGSATPYRLSLVSRHTGDPAAFSVVSTDPGFSLTVVQSAQDALIRVGTTAPQDFYSHTNEFGSVIQGVNLKVFDADDTKTVNVTVQTSVGDTVATVKSFVDSYNALVNAVAEQNAYNAETKAKGGPLFNNPLVTSALADVSNALMSSVDGLDGDVSSIFQIGVSAAKGGLLEVNNATMTDWLTNRYDDVKDFFVASLNSALGAAATATSTAANYDASRVVNGVTDPDQFGADNDGWMDNTADAYPDTLALPFATAKHISRAVVHTLDTDTHPVASFGLKDYDIEALRLGADPMDDASWVTLASVRGNTRGVNSHVINFFTEQMRLKISGVHAADGLSRVVELEAFEATGASRRIGAVVNRISDSVGGLFTSARAEINSEKSRLDKQIESATERVNKEIERLEKAFIQMERAMSRNQTNSQAMTNFLNKSASSSTQQ